MPTLNRMLKLICLSVLPLFIIANDCCGQVPKVTSGTLVQYSAFPSQWMAARNVDVWLPPRYDSNKRYPVLYMQDGKALFDAAIMWNNQEWGVDETMDSLLQQHAIRECIVVGIWNSEATRQADYFPEKAFQLLTPKQQAAYYEATIGERKLLVGKIQSDKYLQFIVKELKPFIEKRYKVLSDAPNTFIAGSSYGGLISLYAICEYPEIFGKAACLSTHWPGTFTTKNNPVPAALLQYLQQHLPSPKNHSIYFDYGDQTLDNLYKHTQQQVDQLMQTKGYTANNWMTLEFIHADHSETAWGRRLHIPLIFLLGNKELTRGQ
jgi:enterochelin esterase-like enzyme